MAHAHSELGPARRLLNCAPMNELQGKHIVLGLSGGVACYKSAELTRLLIKAGASVQVVMTRSEEHTSELQSQR